MFNVGSDAEVNLGPVFLHGIFRECCASWNVVFNQH